MDTQAPSSSVFSLGQMPPELVLLVAEFVDPRTLNRMAKVNRDFHALLNRELYKISEHEQDNRALSYAIKVNRKCTFRRVIEYCDSVEPLLNRPFASNARVSINRAGAKVIARGATSLRGQTPLTWACRCGSNSLVGLLLSHGADPSKPEAADAAGRHSSGPQLFPLHVALAGGEDYVGNVGVDTDIERRKSLIVQKLLARVDPNQMPSKPKKQDDEGFRFHDHPLWFAAEGKGAGRDIIRQLFRAGAKVDAEVLFDIFEQPRSSQGWVELVRRILRQRPKERLPSFTLNGEPALVRLINSYYDFEPTYPFPSVYASVDEIRAKHDEAAAVCCQIMELLVKAGADINAADASTLETPLHAAMTFRAHFDAIIQKLLGLGADPNARGRGGETPLHALFGGGAAGVRLKQPTRLRLLAEGGGDVNARTDDDGATVLHRFMTTFMATTYGGIWLPEFRRLGARFDVVDGAGRRPVDLATPGFRASVLRDMRDAGVVPPRRQFRRPPCLGGCQHDHWAEKGKEKEKGRQQGDSDDRTNTMMSGNGGSRAPGEQDEQKDSMNTIGGSRAPEEQNQQNDILPTKSDGAKAVQDADTSKTAADRPSKSKNQERRGRYGRQPTSGSEDTTTPSTEIETPKAAGSPRNKPKKDGGKGRNGSHQLHISDSRDPTPSTEIETPQATGSPRKPRAKDGGKGRGNDHQVQPSNRQGNRQNVTTHAKASGSRFQQQPLKDASGTGASWNDDVENHWPTKSVHVKGDDGGRGGIGSGGGGGCTPAWRPASNNTWRVQKKGEPTYW